MAETAGALPNLLVIGAMKAGTTSLHYYLNQHPSVQMSSPKELAFFNANRRRGLDWYRSHFSSRFAVRGESCPGYSNSDSAAGVARRIHQLVPEVRLIYLVRHPVDRMISQYVHRVAEGREPRPIEQVLLGADADPYFARSRYGRVLAAYHALLPSRQVLVLRSQDLRLDRTRTMSRIFEFIGVDPSFETVRFRLKRHSSRQKLQPNKATRAVDRLFRVSGLTVNAPGVAGYLQWALSRPLTVRIRPPELSRGFRRSLTEQFREDAELLMRLGGPDCRDWFSQ